MKTGTKNNSTNSLRGKMPPDMAAIIPVIIIIIVLLLRSEPDPTSGHNIDSGFLLHWLFYAVDTEGKKAADGELNWTELSWRRRNPQYAKENEVNQFKCRFNNNLHTHFKMNFVLGCSFSTFCGWLCFQLQQQQNYNSNVFFFSGIQKIILNI